MKNLTLVAAMDFHRGIGINNQLPWKLPEDLAHFKRVTMGQPIIMGRKTFESIGRALPGRLNIVITRDPNWTHPDVARVHTVEAALKLVERLDACVIGGAEIYTELMPYATKLILTRIQSHFNCDAFFPPIDPLVWIEIARETHTSEANKFDYAFITYLRQGVIPNKE